MSDDAVRLREVRAADVQFLADPHRSNPRWYWSAGLCLLLDVDPGKKNPPWHGLVRGNGETWQTRSSEAARAVLMKAGRQKALLVRTTLYLSMPTRRGGLLEQPVHVLAVLEEGGWHVWMDIEDLMLKPNINRSLPA